MSQRDKHHLQKAEPYSCKKNVVFAPACGTVLRPDYIYDPMRSAESTIRRGAAAWALLFLALLVSGSAADAATTNVLVPAGALWKYLDDGTDQGTAWREPGFDDSS